ncbi:MAG TPA: OmpA family protein [bacterium]|nr:OmpA family protein [bacterium]
MRTSRGIALLFLIASASLVGCAHGRVPGAPTAADGARAIPAARVHFTTGSSSIRAGESEKIIRNALWLEANPTAKVVLEGHCDERGALDDNLKLGDLRARAVKAALVESGVEDGGRIVVISLGEGRPIASGHDEAAWRKNRRVEFILQ